MDTISQTPSSAWRKIQIEGVALKGRSRAQRERIMPEGSWDWSISVPLSQGWKVGQRIFVGGQISADENGEATDVGDLSAQTRNILRFIGNVLRDAGASFDDVVHIKVCFKYNSKDVDGASFVDRIMEVTKEVVGNGEPVLTAFAVDLLYPGLDLEIDAMAIVDGDRRIVAPESPAARYQPTKFSDAVEAAGEIYVGGQVALSDAGNVLCADDVAGQARIVFKRLADALGKVDASLGDVVKLNLFLVGEDDEVSESFHEVCKIWSELAPRSHPAMTPVRVHELPRPGLLVQADCIALK